MICSQSAISQKQKKYGAEITTWYKDKSGAISISFDDASFGQFEYAYPTLEKYNIKATFSLVGEWTKENSSYSAEDGNFEIKKMGWRQIKLLHKQGHEIAAHGYEHKNYSKYAKIDILKQQMLKIKNLIEDKINDRVYTLHYPYSFTSDSIVKAAKKAGFLFSRTYSDKLNSSTPENLNLLYSKAILNDNTPNIEEFQKIVQNANDKWLIIMYHHLFAKNSKEDKLLKYHKVKDSYSLYPETFDKQMSIVANSNKWIATEKEIGKYITERENTTINISKCWHTIKVKTKIDLDTEIYNVPLTLKIKVPWKKVKVKENKSENVYTVYGGEILVDVLPGNAIKIKKK